MSNDEKTELLKKYEDLKDSIALINESVPELQKMHTETGKLEKAFKKELEVGLEATKKNMDAALTAKEDTEKAAAYVRSQEAKLNECMRLLQNVSSEIEAIKRRLNQLGNGQTPAQPQTPVARTVRPVQVEYEELSSEDGSIKLAIDREAKKVQLHFSPASKSEPYRESMRSNGFRYYRPQFCWTADLNDTHYNYAKQLVEAKNR